jgi:uncharacterized membrane protein YoaK (UPF0700 family)
MQQDHTTPRMVGILLIVTAATGAIDAVSILHFHTFTAFVTGTMILFGAEIVGQAHAGLAKGVVIVAFFAGAIAGGRLMRRHLPAERLLAHSLAITAVLIGIAAFVIAILGMDRQPVRLAAVGLIAFAMGSQTSATRSANVPDMVLPLVTLVVHGLGHDSRLAGGHSERTWHRIGIVVALTAGAAAGALLSAWYLWAGLSLPAALLAIAGAMATKAEQPKASY